MRVFYDNQKPKVIQFRKYNFFPMKLSCMNWKLLYRCSLKVLEVLKGFSPGVFNRFCVTQRKNSNSGNLEPKTELIIFLFL